MGNKIKKVIVEELDCVGILLNKFEMYTSKKSGKSRSRIIISSENKLLGYIKIFDDGDIELHKYDRE